MDHHRPGPGPVGRRVGEAEPLGEVEVELDGGELPGPPDGIADVHVDLGAVEGAAADVDAVVEAGGVQGGPQPGGGLVPQGLGPHPLVVGAGGQLGLEVLEAEGPQHAEHEVEQRRQLRGHLLGGAEDVAVVLGEAPAAQQAVYRPGALVPVDRPQLEQPDGQVPVAALARPVDHHVERAVHRLRVVVGPVHLHGRVHAVGEEVEVAGGVPQHRLGDVGREHELVAALFVAGPGVVLHDLADQRPLGVPHGQPRTQLGGPRHQVELGGQAAVVALGRLGQSLEVGLEVLGRGPGRAVDALEHRVLLRGPPVGAAGPLQGEVPQLPGGGHMGAAAQVDEPVAVAVVADRAVAGRLSGQLVGVVFRPGGTGGRVSAGRA